MAKISIREERCKGCGLCIEACPKKIIEFSEKLNSKGYHPVTILNQEACIACSSCAKVCPDLVFMIEK